MKPGPVTRDQLNRLGSVWEQGQHILVTGPTGSGKTALSRHILEKRLEHPRNGFGMVMVGKLRPDRTITTDYKGFKRVHKFPSRFSPHDNRLLLWPNTDKYKSIDDKKNLQREVFLEAMDKLSNMGKLTLQVDEGLYTCSSEFLNLGNRLAMLHAMGRSSNLTIMTLAQRPAHLPLIIYSSADHAFVGRMREQADTKRLAELGGKEGSKELAARISVQERHEFTWIPVGPDWSSELVNLKK